MKISLKIFIFTYCIMMLVTVSGGFLLVNAMYENDRNQAQEKAFADNELLYAYIATLEDIPGSTYTEMSIIGLMKRMSGNDRENSIFVGDYAQWKEQIRPAETELTKGMAQSRIIDAEAGKAIQVTSRCEDIYIINYVDISGILARRDANYRLYRQIIIFASVFIAVILYIFSWFITRPLARVTKTAEQIAAGDYSARIPATYSKMRSYEVTKLGQTLNLLAEHTQQQIDELTDMARQKEEFMGNFTHEIKTPMTSIIGYADLMRTYDLEPEKRREYSSYIYREGKRLEQLAQNLLQLLVVGNTEFEMQDIRTEDLFAAVEECVAFLGEKYGVAIEVSQESAVICGEKSLLVTAISNFIDNACKASAAGQKITIFGIVGADKDTYQIRVTDHGNGIAKEEQEKIMEPFYMVDKSRARSQGGAGLGLALCQRIAELHHAKIKMESEVTKGTTVFFTIPCVKEAEDEKA